MIFARNPSRDSDIGGGSGRGSLYSLPIFFQGGSLGALSYAFISTIIPLHECISNLIGLLSKLNPRKELKSRDVFFKNLFVRWGNRKSVIF